MTQSTTSASSATNNRVGIQSAAAHLALLALSAVLLMLAFPHPGWGWIAHVALVPAVLVAVRSASTVRVLWTAYLVSSLWWLLMIRWMIPVTVGGYIGLSLYMAIYLPLSLLAVRYLDKRLRLPITLMLPLVWVSLEFIRCTIWQGGFAWLALAHTQAPENEYDGAGWLIQIADLFGQWGVSFIVAMTNGLIVDLLTRPMFRKEKRGGRSRMHPAMRGAVLLWACVFFGALVYGNYRVRQTADVTVPGPRVAVVQTNVLQDNKISPTAEQMLEDWNRMVALTRQASSEGGVDMIVWPETMVPAALNEDALQYYSSAQTGARGYEIFDRWIRELAVETDAAMLVGAQTNFEWRQVDEGDGRVYEMPSIRYNSAYLYDRLGQQASQRYDKMHRVPFGEYVPYVDSIPWLHSLFIRYISPYDFDYSLQAGRSNTVFELPRGSAPESAAETPGTRGRLLPVRLVTPICFEDVVSQLVHRMVYDDAGQKRADMLVNLTNDGWFAGTHQPHQHLQIAVLRSVENRVPTARSVNTGVSGFIDSAGRIGPLVRVDGSAADVEGYAIHDVQLDTRRTVFGRIGLIPVAVIMLFTAGLLLLAALRPRTAPAR